MGWWKRADTIDERHMPLLQERYEGDHWPILVVSLSLKRTHRSQAEPVVQELLDRYPAPRDHLRADAVEVADLLCPLGLWR
jgi:endonuclease III